MKASSSLLLVVVVSLLCTQSHTLFLRQTRISSGSSGFVSCSNLPLRSNSNDPFICQNVQMLCFPNRRHTDRGSLIQKFRMKDESLSTNDATRSKQADSGGLADSAARRYWDGINKRDVEYALEQFADDVFFQDMMFPEAIKGKDELRAHFETCLAGFPEGLLFKIDEISKDSGDGRCGAYWHCETPDGKAFPFSRGLSFYKCNVEGKIIFAREIPEPSTKTGSAGLAFAKLGAFLMRFIPDSVTFPKV